MKRRAWFEAQPELDPEKLVFIDETWTVTNMARTHGRCARGERLRMGFPHGHRKTTTLVAGLRLGGMVAPMVLDGPINGDWTPPKTAAVSGGFVIHSLGGRSGADHGAAAGVL
jgi:hypothetical protein